MHFSKGKKKTVRDSVGLQEQIISLIIYCLEESIKLESAMGGKGGEKWKGNISVKFKP